MSSVQIHEDHRETGDASADGRRDIIVDDINQDARCNDNQIHSLDPTLKTHVKKNVTSEEEVVQSHELANVACKNNNVTLEQNKAIECTTTSNLDNQSLASSNDQRSGNTGKKIELGQKVSVDEELDDNDGEPIPSGTGVVSKDCSVSELIGWSEILPKWHSKLHQRPKGLDILVRNGIPEPLRGEVWQLLTGAQQCNELMEQYRILLTRSASCESIILRDVHRTYPAHENFRIGSGSSTSLLDSLFKICKAYAVYDEEVGYCQGLSFLGAALLIHMPEEQSFCVFVRIMHHYGLRNLFRNNFDELYLRFYQLEHLIQDYMPELQRHFTNLGLEPFFYASQWFLTVFTAKFPLNAVFSIMDIFLLDGMDTIFQIALALLESSKQELLARDFEGVLKYFRIQLPKLYRDPNNVQQLIKMSSKFGLKKLKRYAKEYEVMKQREKALENPVLRLQRENSKLTENNIRLEQENDDLARDLVASKIQLRTQLDLLEDRTEVLNRKLTYSKQDCQAYLNTISDVEDEKSRLEVEVTQLKEVCRRELQRAETDLSRNNAIITDYKKICSQMSQRVEEQQQATKAFITSLDETLKEHESDHSEKCREMIASKFEEFSKNLASLQGSQALSPTKRSPRVAVDHSNSKPIGALLSSEENFQNIDSETKVERLTEHINELEVELARTKLSLVEAECKCQQLAHDLGIEVASRNQSNDSSHQPSPSNKFDSMLSALTNTRRSPGAALSKLNTLISEKISQTTTHVSSAPTLSFKTLQSTMVWPKLPDTSSKGSESSSDVKFVPLNGDCNSHC